MKYSTKLTSDVTIAAGADEDGKQGPPTFSSRTRVFRVTSGMVRLIMSVSNVW